MSKIKTGEIFGQNIEGVNQILPHVNKWAWDMYKKGKNNNWDPESISMVKDIQNWTNGVLSEAEKTVIKRCLGFFAGSESLVGNNLVSMYSIITDPECRQYMARQIWEECLHNDTIVYICDSLKLDTDEVYSAYVNIPSIKAKDDFLMSITSTISNIDASTLEGKRAATRAAFLYWVVCEGTFFFSGFAMLLSMKSKIPGIGEQIEYTLRDESLHIQFGASVIRKIREQYPEVWSDEFEEELTSLLKKAVVLETSYARDVLSQGILGLNANMFIEYMQYIGNRRLEAVGMKYRYPTDKNPFDFLSEVQDLIKAKNFFESHVTEYQSSGALEDDF
jgi:ribonucleoside-diphosphate reductase beta chain